MEPIGIDDADDVAQFLHLQLNPKVSAAAWRAVLTPPWTVSAPNHGFLLRVGARIVGAYVAVYSERDHGGTTLSVCNLAAFCVLDEYRAQSLLLVRALIRQPGVVFTDLSPSGNVIELNERLGFTNLDTSTRLVCNLPRPRDRRHVVSSAAPIIESALRGPDAAVYRDHRDAAATEHLVVTSGDAYSYLVFRADRRRGLRLFATALYVGGDRALLREAWPSIRSHILRRHRLPFFLAERRLLGFAAGIGRDLRSPRRKMFRGEGLDPAQIDYLYSELALVNW